MHEQLTGRERDGRVVGAGVASQDGSLMQSLEAAASMAEDTFEVGIPAIYDSRNNIEQHL